MISILPELIAVAVFLHVQAHERMWVAFFAAWLPKDLIFVLGSSIAAASAASISGGAAWAYVAAWSFAACAFVLMALRIGFKGAPGVPESVRSN
jgi:hypothetical protein